ncbi:MAG: hypothetical protein R3B39_02010 [Candidatus Paceibacterota bacterium]
MSTEIKTLGTMFAKWAKWDVWQFSLFEWLKFLNQLKKEQIRGLLTGTYVIVERIRYHSATFMTLMVGGVSDFRGILHALEASNWYVNAKTLELIQTGIGLDVETRMIDLVLATKENLGLATDASLGEVFARAKELGLKCCPSETGLRICPQHNYPAEGETLVVATQDIFDATTEMNAVLLVTCYGFKKALKHGPGNKEYRGYETDEFVFVRPRVSK